MSVGENIAYGLPDDYVSKDDVIKAAKAANAHEFIISLPQVMKRGSSQQSTSFSVCRVLLIDLIL